MKLEWGSGIWKRVLTLLERRKGYVHKFISESDLFPDSDIADESIKTVREAVIEIYGHVAKKIPAWILDDDDRGWDLDKGSFASGTLFMLGQMRMTLKELRYVMFI